MPHVPSYLVVFAKNVGIPFYQEYIGRLGAKEQTSSLVHFDFQQLSDLRNALRILLDDLRKKSQLVSSKSC